MGWAAGMAAGTAMAKQALANRDAKEEKERDAAIAKGLSKLDADQALRVKYAAENDPSKISIANTAQSGGLGENTLAPQQNMSPVQSPGAAYTPLQMAEMRRGLYNDNGDPDGAVRYEDQVTGLRAVEESNRRFDTTTANQQSQFDTTTANQQSQFDKTLTQTKAEFTQSKSEFEKQLKISQKQAKDVGNLYGAQISKLIDTVNGNQNDRALAQATTFGENLYSSVVRSGGSIEDIQTALREKYPDEDGVQLDAAMASATNKFYLDNGLNPQVAGNMVTNAVKPIELFVNQEFESEESMFDYLKANKTLEQVFDPNLDDGIATQLEVVFDDAGKPKGYAFMQGKQEVSEVFSSISSIKDYATAEMANISDDPFYLVELQQKAKQKASREIKNATTATAKTKAFNKFLTENPQYLGDGMVAKRMTLKKELGMASELADWGDEGSYVPMGGRGLSTQDQVLGTVDKTRQDRADTAALAAQPAKDAKQIMGLYGNSPQDIDMAYSQSSPAIQAELDKIMPDSMGLSYNTKQSKFFGN